ncbi:unnamed protein product (macronuclear) [Paramecium tetraurelia]|uniref:Calponin-homology (CH) domain-containing protein n=1 Tax=Paramecium tetraurelia TaxID=5888 RepID=A0ECT2_PARTE|nr:uncharacterized protein GSPATT00003968001 [Paramecium tetraurelia]CAK93099.1 unnamed protein product [Paramecium tetraurelia]|eukprot:XP_001460496.1 hypothetical protein (macronuclear) [Paramecium tetraurelia strain d4-2]
MSTTITQTTSKNELVKWINETFKLTITQLETLGTGSTFCQIFEYLYPNSIQGNKIIWKANKENDYIKNFKTLADAFTKNNIQKQLDIQQLSKAKYQDILDLAQFLKSKFDKQTEKRENYDPIEFRKVEERKVFTPTNRKTVSTLKDKTNNENTTTSTHSLLVKRPLSKTSTWKTTKPTFTKTPELNSITEIINNAEDDEATKVKKIKSLFI